MLLGAALILPNLTKDDAKAGMTDEQLAASQEGDLGLVLRPYVGIAVVPIIIWLLIFFRRGMRTPAETHEEAPAAGADKGVFSRLLANPHCRWGSMLSSSPWAPRSAPGPRRSSSPRAWSVSRPELSAVTSRRV